MWTADDITVEIDEVEVSVLLVTVRTPVGALEFMGIVDMRDGILRIDRAHVQGLSPGALTRAGLNAIGRKILEETGAQGLVVQGSTRATGRNVGSTPSPIRFPVSVFLSARDVPRPVDAIRLLASFGMSLRKGMDTFDRLFTSDGVATEFIVAEGRDPVAELAALGITARPLRRPDVRVAEVRRQLGLSQAEFATRFGLELDTVQNWEQGRNRPDPAAMVLLKVIEQNPAAVDAALAG